MGFPFNIPNRTLLWILILSAVFALTGGLVILSGNRDARVLLIAGAFVFYIFGTILLLKEGSFLSSRYSGFINYAVMLHITGMVLRFFSGSTGFYIIVLAYTLFLTGYSLHFLSKPRKAFHDILKVLVVPCILAGAVFKVMHFPYGNVLYGSAFLLMAELVIWQLFVLGRNGKLSQPGPASPKEESDRSRTS